MTNDKKFANVSFFLHQWFVSVFEQLEY